MNSVEFLDVVLSKSEKFGDMFMMLMREGLWHWRFIDPRLRANDNPAGVGDLSDQTSPVGGAPNSPTQGISFIWEMSARMPSNMIKILNSGFSEWADRHLRGGVDEWDSVTAAARKKSGENAWDEIRHRDGKKPMTPSAAVEKFVANFHFPDAATIERLIENGGDDPFIRPLAAALGAEGKADSAEAAALRIFGAGAAGVSLETEDAKRVMRDTPEAASFFFSGDGGAISLVLDNDGNFLRADGSKFDAAKAKGEMRVRISDRWNVIAHARATDEQLNADWAYGVSHLVVGPGRAMDAVKDEAITALFSAVPDIQNFKKHAAEGDLPQLSITAQTHLNGLFLISGVPTYAKLLDFFREKSRMKNGKRDATESEKETVISKALGLTPSDIAGKSSVVEVIRERVIVAKDHDWKMDFDAFDTLRLDLSNRPAVADLFNMMRPMGRRRIPPCKMVQRDGQDVGQAG